MFTVQEVDQGKGCSQEEVVGPEAVAGPGALEHTDCSRLVVEVAFDCSTVVGREEELRTGGAVLVRHMGELDHMADMAPLGSSDCRLDFGHTVLVAAAAAASRLVASVAVRMPLLAVVEVAVEVAVVEPLEPSES